MAVDALSALLWEHAVKVKARDGNNKETAPTPAGGHAASNDWQSTLSHTSMNGGRFLFSSQQYAQLMSAWGAALESGIEVLNLPSLVERHRHIGPVIIDIDLRQPDSSLDRLYNDADVVALVSALYDELGRLVDLTETDSRCFVLEKPGPRRCKGGGFKDGLHIELPMVVTRAEVQVALRRAMLPHVGRILFNPLDPERFSNSAEDAYDEAVIEHAGWMLYGAKKPDEPDPWKVTRLHVLSTCKGFGWGRKPPTQTCLRAGRANGLVRLKWRCKCQLHV